jgi:hypothetical protein
MICDYLRWWGRRLRLTRGWESNKPFAGSHAVVVRSMAVFWCLYKAVVIKRSYVSVEHIAHIFRVTEFFKWTLARLGPGKYDDWKPRKTTFIETSTKDWRKFHKEELQEWHCSEYVTLGKRTLPEKLTVPEPVEKFPTFYETRRFITVFTTARNLSLSWARLIQSYLTSWPLTMGPISCPKRR